MHLTWPHQWSDGTDTRTVLTGDAPLLFDAQDRPMRRRAGF